MTKLVKIDSKRSRDSSPLHTRAFMKHKLKVDRRTLFTDPIVSLDDEQWGRFERLVEFCKSFGKCANGCRGFINLKNYSVSSGGGIRGLCSECVNYAIDDSPQAREHVAWLDSVLADYGMSFEDGFPKLLRHEKRGMWCRDCQMYHTTMEFFDYR